MPLNSESQEVVKREVYLCYDDSDEFYKKEFESFLAKRFTIKNVEIQDREKMNPETYIHTLLTNKIITSETIILVFVGNETFENRFVDWEIHAGLKDGKNKELDSHCALVALVTPNFKFRKEKAITRRAKIPKRLLDNIDSKYCKIYPWTYSITGIQKVVNDAYSRKEQFKSKRVNTAPRLESSK